MLSARWKGGKCTQGSAMTGLGSDVYFFFLFEMLSAGMPTQVSIITCTRT